MSLNSSSLKLGVCPRVSLRVKDARCRNKSNGSDAEVKEHYRLILECLALVLNSWSHNYNISKFGAEETSLRNLSPGTKGANQGSRRKAVGQKGVGLLDLNSDS